MRLRTLTTLCIVLLALVGLVSINALASANAPQDSTSISFTVTTTTNYPVATGGAVKVNFDSVQLTTPPPQAYSFGVSAKTAQGLSIIRLHWDFGDGASKDVPYCCQGQVSEVEYHSYAQPGSYTVIVIAYDNGGNFGYAAVTVNWVTPIPEYPTYGLPVFVSLFAALAAAAYARGKHSSLPALPR